MAESAGLDCTARICAEIDLDAIRFNMESMHRNLNPDVQMTAVIKANGYGHGAVRIAHEIEDLPYLWGFATATFEEARELRESGIRKPILILGYVFPYCFRELARLGIRPAVFRRDMIRELGEAARQEGKKIYIHMAVDTGMSRIGVSTDEAGADLVKEALQETMLEAEGIFTHFARADETDLSAADAQYARFESFLQLVRERTGYTFPIRHCSNSAGIISLPS
ncbi:MAG: alanine racemase, partial [Lachnospiraceae bacterium]|nr:alanine racemase [Lachnospiraceae bacterium]